MKYTMQEFLRESDRRQKAKSRRKRLCFLVLDAMALAIFVGPCSPINHLKPDRTASRYGESIDWDGTVSFLHEPLSCSWGHCFY